MRQDINRNPTLDIVPIGDIQINPESRDDIDRVLRVLQKIGSTSSLREQVLSVIKTHMTAAGARQDAGRPGMSYWRMFVLMVIKNVLKCDYDRLAALANSYIQLRQILQHGIWEEDYPYSHSTIQNNLEKMTDVLVRELNPIVTKQGLKKLIPPPERSQTLWSRGRKAKGPPLDVRRLFDAVTRSVNTAIKASKAYNLTGWRQHAYLKRSFERTYQMLDTSSSYSGNPELVGKFLGVCTNRIKKCKNTHAMIAETDPESPWLVRLSETAAEAERFHDMVELYKVKVTVLTNEYPPNIYGGAGVHVKYLVRELAKHHRVQVYSFGKQRRSSDALSVKGVVDTGAPKGNDSRFNKLFGTLHRNQAMAAAVEDPQIIHCHTWYSHWAGILAKQLTGGKLVLTTHSLEPHRPWKAEQLGRAYHMSSWIEKTAYQEADAVIAVSPQMKEDVVSLYGVSHERVHVIPNGIDLDEYQPAFDETVLRSYGVNPEIPYVLFVGRITRQKGIIHLLHAIAHLDPGTQIILAAGAPDTPEIEVEMIQEVTRLKKSDEHHVVWIREMMPPSELIVLYSHAQVFACPSVYEPFGIINLEAMACETAVVATKVGGIPMVVVDGETGLLVELEGDGFAERLADSINQLMRDPERSRAMGLQGRARVETRFSWEVVAKQTVELYRRLLTKR